MEARVKDGHLGHPRHAPHALPDPHEVEGIVERRQAYVFLYVFHDPVIDNHRAAVLIAPVDDPARLEAVLTRSLGVRGVVEKTRRLYLWRHTRIHLDEVEGLGRFVELETVANRISLDEAEREAREVIEFLGLDPSTFLDRPYLELLEARSPARTDPGLTPDPRIS